MRTAFCQQLFIDRVNVGPSVVSNPWATPACIYGATCFGGSRPVDDFLASVASTLNTTFEASLDVPRVSSAVCAINIFSCSSYSNFKQVFDQISTDGQVITQQNYIDGVFGTLAATNGPFPDASLVISSYQRVVIWTDFCNANGVPFQNFADYFQFSATVSSNGCTITSS